MSTYYAEIIALKTRGAATLTYQCLAPPVIGQMVVAPYGSRAVVGVIVKPVTKPEFETKILSNWIDLPAIPKYCLDLAQWISDYYAVSLPEAMLLFIPTDPQIKSRLKLDETKLINPKWELNHAQQLAIETIHSSPKRQWLLHGVTGSGKTAIYIELCKRALAAKQSALILVPEIALTTQITAEFQARFKDQVVVYHSGLGAAQRRARWQYVLTSTKPVIVIAPRSGLFMPFTHLGLIVMDESHETSYKQDQSPRYHARDVAAKLASLTGAKLVLGSATPSAQEIFLQRQGKLELISLLEAVHINKRRVEIVDMRQHNPGLSPKLRAAISKRLARHEQSLLFINRRGSASQVLCGKCGFITACRSCKMPLTWHGDIGKMQCHWCGISTALTGRCPECQASNWKFIGTGTKQVEVDLRREFPHAVISRIDRDSTKASTIAADIDKLRNGSVDIIIGTQMVAKGLDLPKVTLVGVVLADTLLYVPDINSSERTYQLLHQVIGRSGRQASQDSQIIIQTYHPEHPVIIAAANQDFANFMTEELSQRQELGYPPYCYLLKLTVVRKTKTGATKAGAKLATDLAHKYPNIIIKGPAPAWREYYRGSYYWQLIISAKTRSTLSEIARKVNGSWRVDLDPIELL